MQRRNLAAGLMAAVLAAMLGVGVAAPAVAQGPLALTTTYPAVTADAGDTVSFSIRVANHTAGGQTVYLEVAEAPDGWEDVALRGGGRVINAAHVAANDTSFVDLSVKVPSQAAEGAYDVVVAASGEDASDSLRLTVNVAETTVAQSELSAELPVLRGPSGAAFEYDLTLANNSGEQQLFALAAEAPEGFEVSFKPSFGSQQITSIPVDAGASERLTLEIRTPERMEAGEYTVPVQAVGSGTGAETEVTLNVTGSYGVRLRLRQDLFSFDATAGEPATVQLLLDNTGTAPLTGVSLSDSFSPQDWEVEFGPQEIESIPPGETSEVTMTVTPKARAIAGDYIMTVRAGGEQASDTADVRVTVNASTLWGWVGLLLVAAAVAGTFAVFRVYGRR